jgi:plasmid stabilization system protein ParE
MEVKWEARAAITWESIIRYRFEVAGSLSAKQLLKKIDTDVARFATYPQIGSRIEGLEGLQGEYRSLVTGEIYKLVYRIEQEVVYIATLFDCRNDPERLPRELSD